MKDYRKLICLSKALNLALQYLQSLFGILGRFCPAGEGFDAQLVDKAKDVLVGIPIS